MAFSIWESDRIDRYEFEIFIGQVNFTGLQEESNNCNANKKKVSDESKLKVNQLKK